MKKITNQERIEGYVYQHELAIKKVQNEKSKNFGKDFISGTIDVVVDEEGLNVVQVHFTYVTEYSNAGKKNSTFTNLKKIIEEGKTWIVNGKEEATKVRIDTALALNDFYSQDNTLVSVKTNEGGFVSLVAELAPVSKRNEFTFDIFITSTKKVEADEEKGIEAPYLVLKGATFNFRNDILPIDSDLVVKNPDGIKYFENLEISPSTPIFTKIWGKINSTTVKTQSYEESAFGEPSVKFFEKKTKEWEVVGTSSAAYDFGDPVILCAEDIETAMQNREVHLAEVKKQAEEYRESKIANQASTFLGAMNAPSTPMPATKGSFNLF